MYAWPHLLQYASYGCFNALDSNLHRLRLRDSGSIRKTLKSLFGRLAMSSSPEDSIWAVERCSYHWHEHLLELGMRREELVEELGVGPYMVEDVDWPGDTHGGESRSDMEQED